MTKQIYIHCFRLQHNVHCCYKYIWIVDESQITRAGTLAFYFCRKWKDADLSSIWMNCNFCSGNRTARAALKNQSFTSLAHIRESPLAHIKTGNTCSMLCMTAVCTYNNVTARYASLRMNPALSSVFFFKNLMLRICDKSDISHPWMWPHEGAFRGLSPQQPPKNMDLTRPKSMVGIQQSP